MQSFTNMTVGDFLQQAASDAPVPGGGAIAALVGALGCSMASMAANFTIGKPKFAEHEEAIGKILEQLTLLTQELRKAVDADAQAFATISAAYTLPKNDAAEKEARKLAIQNALTASMRVPLQVARWCDAAALLLPELTQRNNPNLLSDIQVAAIMTAAAAKAALVNIHANSASLHSDEARQAESEGQAICDRTAAVEDEVREAIRLRLQ